MKKNQDVPIFVINLKRDKERLLFMQKQFEALDKEFRLIQAIDGRKLTAEQLSKYSKEKSLRNLKRELNDADIAVVLSHIKVWEIIREEQIEDALVLEDDIFLNKTLFNILENRDKLPRDYEFINFCTDVLQVPFGEYIADDFRASYYLGYANRTSAYLINSKGIEKLLNNVYPICFTIDGFTGRTYKTDLISYGISPDVAYLNNFESSIWGTYVNYQLNFFMLKRQQLLQIIYAIFMFFGLSKLLVKISNLIYFSFPKLRRR